MLPRTFHCITFGCQMNVNDSDWLARSLTARGFTPVPPDRSGEANIYVINTCSVRDKPEQKVYSEIGRIRSMTGDDPDVLVCVGGCVAQQVGRKLFGRFSQVRLVFGADGIAQAPPAVEKLLENRSLRVSLLDFEESYAEREQAWPEPGQETENGPGREAPVMAKREAPVMAGRETPVMAERETPVMTGNAPSVFVSIMQGCDNFCAYCIVPYVRGRQKSRTPEAVLDECRAWLARGAREITLLGQNVNSFGQDGGTRGVSFTGLLYRVAALPGLERLRFVTPHPKDLAPELIEAFRDLPVLAPRVHLPLQSGSDRILALMGRRYDRARYRDIVNGLRAARPGIHVSTDIIVGFPGETEEDFQETLDFMREIGFVGSFSFVYSDRPGTRASLFKDKVERNTALERLARLQDWQYAHAWDVLRGLTGEKVDVLLEEPSPKPREGEVIWQGKEPRGHSVNVVLTGPEPEGGWKGKIVPARVTEAAMHSLRAEQAGDAF